MSKEQTSPGYLVKFRLAGVQGIEEVNKVVLQYWSGGHVFTSNLLELKVKQLVEEDELQDIGRHC